MIDNYSVKENRDKDSIVASVASLDEVIKEVNEGKKQSGQYQVVKTPIVLNEDILDKEIKKAESALGLITKIQVDLNQDNRSIAILRNQIKESLADQYDTPASPAIQAKISI